MTDRKHPATSNALDAVCFGLVHSRNEGLEDADAAAATVLAAIALWAHVHGKDANQYADKLRDLFLEMEAARIIRLDARLFGEARGNA